MLTRNRVSVWRDAQAQGQFYLHLSNEIILKYIYWHSLKGYRLYKNNLKDCS
jgi:hypothetical protein